MKTMTEMTLSLYLYAYSLHSADCSMKNHAECLGDSLRREVQENNWCLSIPFRN